MKAIGLALFAICLTFRVDAAGDPDFSQVEALMRERISAGVPSIAIAVAQHGQIIWERAFGFSDLESRVGATPRTPYYMASISKTITATALLELVERGRIDLDRPVNNYLRDAKVSSPMWDVSQATVRRLANHTAGLTTYDRGCLPADRDCGFSATNAIRRYGVIVWPPGERFDYSNLDYGILDEVIAERERTTLAATLERRVFTPLRMSDCLLGSDNHRARAVRYVTGSPPARTPAKSPPARGASPVYCSAHDLVQFGMFHLKDHLPSQKRVLSDGSIDLMQKSSLPPGEGSQYGLSWWLQEDLHGFQGVLAQGGTSDATAYLQLIPSQDVAVAMLWNTGTPSGAAMVDQVLAALLPQYRANLTRPPAEPRPAPPVMTEPPAEIVGKWSGFIQTYKGRVSLSLGVSATRELTVQLGSELELRRKPPRFVPGIVRWTMPGSLGVEGEPFDLDFRMELHGDILAGAARTVPPQSGGYAPQLYYWVELHRK